MPKKTIGRFVVGERPLSCPLCAGETFTMEKAEIKDASTSLFTKSFTGPTVWTLTCDDCQRIEWFRKPPEVRQSV